MEKPREKLVFDLKIPMIDQKKSKSNKKKNIVLNLVRYLASNMHHQNKCHPIVYMRSTQIC